MTLETRIPPPLVALIFGGFIWWMASVMPPFIINTQLKIAVISVLLVLGIFCSLAGVLSFRKVKTTIHPMNPHEASSLVCNGMYRKTRNPMYLGLALVLSGWAFYLNCPEALIGVLGFMLYIQIFQILPEERALIKVFGDEYREYKSRVRRWL